MSIEEIKEHLLKQNDRHESNMAMEMPETGEAQFAPSYEDIDALFEKKESVEIPDILMDKIKDFIGDNESVMGDDD